MTKAWIVSGAVAVAALVLVAANYHIVTGSTVSGVTFQKKMSMSLSETFVNLDSVGNMPMIVARAQYPMFVASMERAITATEDALVKACGKDIQVGMSKGVVLHRCGQPANVETEDFDVEKMRWRTGLLVHVQHGLVTYVSGR
ncbi:hypothetical protein Daci_3215 [Delftia acidovorans SPH-1]|uniref:Uncharacterized protein n=1 Tax=Delftia acidovorans (strain DSM 14801 / SPH-1) TaxID=398578 RepID=A9BW37_DELAS|nr:hypothetical protein [Delftia acidovorans]ABX35853.1 hypothetical protein Daci_3215 [Delftia acidovorans SPH-1]QPS74869.1 hypothetical protein I6G48_30415 [Delftia acidovorans]